MDKYPLSITNATEAYRFALSEGPILVSPGSYEDSAYIGSQEGTLYAVDITSGRTQWRYAAGTQVTRPPVALVDAVYVVAGRNGMASVDRASGDAVWRIPRRGRTLSAVPEADRFFAANPKFVYAADASGRLLVLDRRLGTPLSVYEGTRDFTFPVVNDTTDRVLLAANNGLLVSLRDRDYPEPVYHRRIRERSTDPRAAAVEEKLSQQVSDPLGGEPAPLGTVLKGFEKAYGLKFLVSEKAFQEAGVANVNARLVSSPRVNRVPLGDVLRRVLAQVDASYRVVEDTVLIYPAPRR
jgi:hypothetical protein